MNVELLQRVRHHIETHPERFCAAHWAWAVNVRQVLEQDAEPAGFKCCIAGHVLLLSGRFDERTLLRYSVSCDDGFLGRCAREVLRLNDAQRRALFYPSQWSEPFRSSYYLAADPLAEGPIAAAYLAHFVAEYGGAGAGAGHAEDRPPLPHQAVLAVRPAPEGPVEVRR